MLNIAGAISGKVLFPRGIYGGLLTSFTTYLTETICNDLHSEASNAESKVEPILDTKKTQRARQVFLASYTVCWNGSISGHVGGD